MSGQPPCCWDCVHSALRGNSHECRRCIIFTNRPNFTPKEAPAMTPAEQQTITFSGDPAVTPGPTKAATYDDGKAPLAVLPWAALDAMAQVQAYGHRKYGDFYNYRKGMEVSRNLSCAIRHIRDYMNGHDVDVGKGTPEDPGSGLNPLAHAAVRIAFVLQNLADGKAIDDRYKEPTA